MGACPGMCRDEEVEYLVSKPASTPVPVHLQSLAAQLRCNILGELQHHYLLYKLWPVYLSSQDYESLIKERSQGKFSCRSRLVGKDDKESGSERNREGCGRSLH